MSYIAGQNSKAIALEIHNENRRKKMYESKISNYLKELGKYSAFLEEFENVKLEAQDLPNIETIDDIKTNEHFLEGRKFGFTLIANGFSMGNFNKYMMEREKKKHR